MFGYIYIYFFVQVEEGGGGEERESVCVVGGRDLESTTHTFDLRFRQGIQALETQRRLPARVGRIDWSGGELPSSSSLGRTRRA